jgi:hypothetical protein
LYQIDETIWKFGMRLDGISKLINELKIGEWKVLSEF